MRYEVAHCCAWSQCCVVLTLLVHRKWRADRKVDLDELLPKATGRWVGAPAADCASAMQLAGLSSQRNLAGSQSQEAMLMHCSLSREAVIEKKAARREAGKERDASPDLVRLPGGGDVMGGDDSFAAAKARCDYCAAALAWPRKLLQGWTCWLAAALVPAAIHRLTQLHPRPGELSVQLLTHITLWDVCRCPCSSLGLLCLKTMCGRAADQCVLAAGRPSSRRGRARSGLCRPIRCSSGRLRQGLLKTRACSSSVRWPLQGPSPFQSASELGGVE